MKFTHPYYTKFYDHLIRHGKREAVISVFSSLFNRRMHLTCFYVTLLDRDHVIRPPAEKGDDLHFKFSDLNLLLEMKQQGIWGIDAFLIDRFKEGDVCLLAYVGQELAGYTWVHSKCRPLLLPGLRLEIPQGYIYNYAGFTLPRFRGLRLQSRRHYEVISNSRWSGSKGLVGYVDFSNWASIKGQKKGGMRKIGKMWLIGGKVHFMTFLSEEVKEFGIRRLKE
jgi:hypothetical protein